jgi:hypothetical protein
VIADPRYEVLIDLEEDRAARAVVFGLPREMERTDQRERDLSQFACCGLGTRVLA